MSLEPIQQKSLPEIVEERIVEYIRSANLAVGQPLPGEKELAERFRVSRSVVREAVTRLRMLGLVDSRRNRGMVLCPPDPLSGFAKAVRSPLLGSHYERELMELRVIHELGIADLFWDRKTAQDINGFHELAVQLDTHPDYPHVTQSNRNLEITFHGKLFEVAGNRLVMRMRGLLTRFYGLEKLHARTPPLKKPDLPSHRDLVAIMKDGARTQFREALYQHLKVYLDVLNMERCEDAELDDVELQLHGRVLSTND
jgi:GntR family transcriptional regulator, transcriptional repressor for pyruvate dehydrogenase complex